MKVFLDLIINKIYSFSLISIDSMPEEMDIAFTVKFDIYNCVKQGQAA